MYGTVCVDVKNIFTLSFSEWLSKHFASGFHSISFGSITYNTSGDISQKSFDRKVP